MLPSVPSIYLFFSFHCHGDHRALHSFPTRRSSDLYPDVGTSAKASVTKTLEYSYDDFALALLAREMGDQENYEYFMERSGNYRNLFDRETGFMRGRVESGEFASQFDPKFPHYYYQYREANAWNGSFYVPHDTPRAGDSL